MPEASLNRSMDNAKKHYSSLFFLPSFKKSLLSNIALCGVGITLTTYALFPNINSLTLGVTLFIITLATDLIVIKAILRNDPIFIIRRVSAMSFYCWLIWLAFMALGAVLGYFFGSLLWIKLALIGYAAVMTLRIMVLSATSFAAIWRQIISALLQPLLCIVALLIFWAGASVSVTLQVLPFVLLAPIISYSAVYLFLLTLDRLGKTSYGLPAMSFFKAFLLNWVTDANAPLEKHLEETGQDADISVSLIKFDAQKPKAAIIMPMVHPGPFKNIGSSLLPSMIKHDFEEEYGCDACTPLGILGHELDLASQAQNKKIVAEILKEAKIQVSSSVASPFVRTMFGCGIASCQIFGDTSIISFSLAPKTTEDLPQELGRMVTEEAKRFGLKHAIIVNSHNALDDESADMNEHIEELKQAAFECLKKASALPAKSFKIGSATVYPAEFTQKMGMGTGGITAIAVEVDAQKVVYVVIDGNNMVPRLREKILSALETAGFDECEVFTTDTHAVSALVTGRRGYHPIGEAINHDSLITYILESAKKATSNLETAKSGFVEFVVPNVRVIGEERLNSISILVDKAITQAKKTAPAIFGAEGLILLLMLLLF
jgi:predicted neutral ceramidase superfamily lipid hydrolase